METEEAQITEMTLEPGRVTGGPDNYHPESGQWLFVHAGSGWAVVDGEEHVLETVSLSVPPRESQ